MAHQLLSKFKPKLIEKQKVAIWFSMSFDNILFYNLFYLVSLLLSGLIFYFVSLLLSGSIFYFVSLLLSF